MPKHKGVTFDFGGGNIYVIPPISVVSMVKLRGKMKTIEVAMKQNDWTAGVDACIDVVHEALIRNYPDMTRDQVANMMDLGNIADAIFCAADIGGNYRKRLDAEMLAGASRESGHV